MVGSSVPLYLEPKQTAWLAKHNNKSDIVRGLINEAMEKESTEESIRDQIILLESNRITTEERLNSCYESLKMLLEKKHEVHNAQKERMRNLLKERDQEKRIKFSQLIANPYFKDIQRMKEYDDKRAVAIVEKCRRAGNRDFGTYLIKEFIEKRNDGGDEIVKELMKEMGAAKHV